MKIWKKAAKLKSPSNNCGTVAHLICEPRKFLIAYDYFAAPLAIAINTLKGAISRQLQSSRLTITPGSLHNHRKISCDMIICASALCAQRSPSMQWEAKQIFMQAQVALAVFCGITVNDYLRKNRRWSGNFLRATQHRIFISFAANRSVSMKHKL